MNSLAGVVIKGDGLGRRLGFPTANIRVSPLRKLEHGVFKVSVRGGGLGGRPGACNIGVRPTLKGAPRLQVEVHIPGFSGDLYGKRLTLIFIAKMRDERRFPSLAALKARIRRDIRSLGAY